MNRFHRMILVGFLMSFVLVNFETRARAQALEVVFKDSLWGSCDRFGGGFWLPGPFQGYGTKTTNFSVNTSSEVPHSVFLSEWPTVSMM